MKKKIIIPIVIFVLIILIVLGFILIKNNNYYIITLDINPSIEIDFNKDETVKEVKALNKDAKELISNNYKNKKLDKVMEELIIKINKKDYNYIENLKILFYSNYKNNSYANRLSDILGKNNSEASLIVIDKITDKDKKLAKKYNITQAKAAYINSIVKNNKKINIKDLINKTINELNITERSGNYCDDGYILEGDNCLKEISREKAEDGMVCPNGYFDYNGTCYEEAKSTGTGKYYCNDGLNQEGEYCIGIDEIEPDGKCTEGEYHQNEKVCVVNVYIQDAEEFCRDPGRTLYEHKCLATKPTINGGCLGSDIVVNGNCVNTIDDYYESEWKCPDRVISNGDGSLLYPDKKCYEEKKVEPDSFTCPKDYELKDKKCIKHIKERPLEERICDTGSKLIPGDRCITEKTKEKIKGKICDKIDSRLVNDMCVTYKIIDAKH